jgi:hypothetical protein
MLYYIWHLVIIIYVVWTVAYKQFKSVNCRPLTRQSTTHPRPRSEWTNLFRSKNGRRFSRRQVASNIAILTTGAPRPSVAPSTPFTALFGHGCSDAYLQKWHHVSNNVLFRCPVCRHRAHKLLNCVHRITIVAIQNATSGLMSLLQSQDSNLFGHWIQLFSKKKKT